MKIPREVVEEIVRRNDIEQVISSYVTLKPAGSNMVGLCPFHSENSPSFTVFGGDDHFYCFGCGAGGDVITFVMRMENVDYPTALELLAKRAGVEGVVVVHESTAPSPLTGGLTADAVYHDLSDWKNILLRYGLM